ncbi:hypothetical protein ACH5RR_009323 [Cinchona calisaya]|uniref:UBN2_3 domain-containing protein n=1 Tax=Cinchona calisaya TaxID=153742 RepID=A0ABD3AE01_9GENT
MEDMGSNLTKESIFKINTNNGIGIKLTTFPLNGKIFSLWVNVSRRGLITQWVFGYVNGDIRHPKEGTKEYHEWLYTDKIVVTWIINSIYASQVGTLQSAKDAKDLWEAINQGFRGKGNLLRIYDLKQDLQSLNLKNSDFLNYSNEVKETWYEIHALHPPTTDLDELKRENEDMVMSLLSGIRSKFSELRYSILRNKEVPLYEKVIGMVEK